VSDGMAEGKNLIQKHVPFGMPLRILGSSPGGRSDFESAYRHTAVIRVVKSQRPILCVAGARQSSRRHVSMCRGIKVHIRLLLADCALRMGYSD